jgi:hypothetical protein
VDEGPQVNVTGGEAVTDREPGAGVTSEVASGSGSLPDADRLTDADALTDTDMLTDAGAYPDASAQADADEQAEGEAPAVVSEDPEADARADAGRQLGPYSPDAGPQPEADAPQQPDAADGVGELAEVLTALTAFGGRLDDVAAAATELARLRARDTDLVARLHEDVTRLRTGEIAAALNPVVIGMIKLHDQMVSLGALSDPGSPVGMLHTQLLQVMELTCAVRPFTPDAGERFDASRHTGARRIPTTDASADGTIASTIRAGFARADGSVVRVAEVEVRRLSG